MLQINFSFVIFCLHQEFNAGLFDYLIATDDSEIKEKEQPKAENRSERKKSRKHAKAKLDSEFGVVRGIDFKNVHTVWQMLSIRFFKSGSRIHLLQKRKEKKGSVHVRL